MIHIALAGNPNSGKTTIYNYLTGKSERVGNWTGVTVDIKKAHLKKRLNIFNDDVTIVDLPGTYGMESYTLDEKVSTDYLKSDDVDAILNVIDMSQLEKGLVFTLELLKINKPVVIMLNKQDVAKKQKVKIDIDQLQDILDSTVICTQATKNKGVKDAITLISQKIGSKKNE